MLILPQVPHNRLNILILARAKVISDMHGQIIQLLLKLALNIPQHFDSDRTTIRQAFLGILEVFKILNVFQNNVNAHTRDPFFHHRIENMNFFISGVK